MRLEIIKMKNNLDFQGETLKKTFTLILFFTRIQSLASMAGSIFG